MKRTLTIEQHGKGLTTIHIPADLWESYWRNKFAAEAIGALIRNEPKDDPIGEDDLVMGSFGIADAMLAEMKRRESDHDNAS